MLKGGEREVSAFSGYPAKREVNSVFACRRHSRAVLSADPIYPFVLISDRVRMWPKMSAQPKLDQSQIFWLGKKKSRLRCQHDNFQQPPANGIMIPTFMASALNLFQLTSVWNAGQARNDLKL